jgi:hypothetical protein
MPVGTGNDLSQILGYGGKMNLLRLNRFIRTILKDDLPQKKYDLWQVTLKNTVPCLNNQVAKKKSSKYKPKNFSKGMLIYMGIGYDAYVIYYFEQFRRFFPYLVISSKVSKLYIAGMFIFLVMRSIFRSFLSRLYQFMDVYSNLNLAKTSNEKNSKLVKLDENRYQLCKMNNIIILNGKSRAGGFKNEWKKSRRAAVNIDDRNIILKKNNKGEWKCQRELYSSTKSIHLYLFSK